MRLRNHIAYRFLTDDKLVLDYLIGNYQNEGKVFEPKDIDLDKEIDMESKSGKAIFSGWRTLNRKGNKSFLVTDTVLDKLDLLKVKRNGTDFDWSVFFGLTNRKETFILPKNQLLRIAIYENFICFAWLDFKFQQNPKSTVLGITNWVQFWVNKESGELCEHFQHKDVKSVDEFIYKLMCFVYLSENEEIILKSGQSHGTMKTGKVINELPVTLTILNSRWNITSIRTDGFAVRGHFALRRFGKGRSDSRMVYIEPYEKSGYVRRSGMEINNEHIKTQ